jgi:hypothetical protein
MVEVFVEQKFSVVFYYLRDPFLTISEGSSSCSVHNFPHYFSLTYTFSYPFIYVQVLEMFCFS